jgi:hypothetical protein
MKFQCTYQETKLREFSILRFSKDAAIYCGVLTDAETNKIGILFIVRMALAKVDLWPV